MNPFLSILGLRMPGFLKKWGLTELFRISARAFEVPMPDLRGLNQIERLERFAEFTRDQVRLLQSGGKDVFAVREALFSGAYRMGNTLRRLLRISTLAEAMDAAALLYQAIGIDFRGNAQGEIVISRCFFSTYYSPETCRFISALDEGILAGLAGKNRLIFDSRITENDCICRARFLIEEMP